MQKSARKISYGLELLGFDLILPGQVLEDLNRYFAGPYALDFYDYGSDYVDHCAL